MKYLFSFLSLFALSVSGAVSAAEHVVMKVVGDVPYSIGDVIVDGQAIEIPAESSLLVISSLGKKVSVQGPFVGALGGEDGAGEGDAKQAEPGIGIKVNLVSNLARLFKTQVVDTSSLGAFRSVGEGVLSDPWSFEITDQTNYCYQSPSELNFWRKGAARSEKVMLKSANDEVVLNWGKGQHGLSWPVDLPPVSGQGYNVVVGQDQSVAFSLYQAPQDLPTRIHIAAWMAEKKCDKQAMLLVVNSDIDSMLEGLAQDGKF